MKQAKRFLAFAAAVLLVCSLASCGGNEDGSETTSAPAVTSETTSEVSSEADTSDVSETTTSAAESDDGQDTTAGSSAKPANSSSGSSNSKSSGSSKSSSSKSSGGSSSKSQSSGSQKPASKPADKPAQTQPAPVWTQAEVDALVAEIKSYAQSKGFSINSSLTTEGTSWSNPVYTGKDKAKTKADLKYEIDFTYEGVLQDFGYIPDSAALNVIAEAIGSNDWAIYVVY